MDFVPNVPRLVGPAGDSGGFLFGSAPSGSLVPSSRHDAVAHTAGELKMSSSSPVAHQSKCSMVPHNRPPVSILPGGESIKLDHNGLLLPSPGSPSPSPPLLAAAASPSSPSPAKKAPRTAAVDATKVDGADQLA